MAVQASQKSDFITKVRNCATDLLEAFDCLRALRQEWDNLMVANITDPDFIGSNSGIVTVDLASVIGTTLDALQTTLDLGHDTNLYKLKI